MRTLSAIILLACYTFNSTSAQMNIKQVIYDDLLALNDMYNGCIIQFNQEKWIIMNNDTIKHINTLTTLLDSSATRVLIVEIDSINQFYFVAVKFDLLANAPYFNLFSENTFKYVLCQENNKYYKINGFLVSDILYVRTPAKLLKSMPQINAPNKFEKHLKKRDITKIRNYLSVSVLKVIILIRGYIL